jgi:hypothetical protein
MKSCIFWDITLFHWKSTDVSEEHVACFHAAFFPGLFFDLKDVGNMFHRNVGSLLTDYVVFYPRK